MFCSSSRQLRAKNSEDHGQIGHQPINSHSCFVNHTHTQVNCFRKGPYSTGQFLLITHTHTSQLLSKRAVSNRAIFVNHTHTQVNCFRKGPYPTGQFLLITHTHTGQLLSKRAVSNRAIFVNHTHTQVNCFRKGPVSNRAIFVNHTHTQVNCFRKGPYPTGQFLLITHTHKSIAFEKGRIQPGKASTETAAIPSFDSRYFVLTIR